MEYRLCGWKSLEPETDRLLVGIEFPLEEAQFNGSVERQ